MPTLTFLNRRLGLTVCGDGYSDVVSDLERLVCPSCECENCCHSCDGSQGADENNREGEDDVLNRLQYNAALDGLESLLLALVGAGVIDQQEDPKVNEAIQTTLDAIVNTYL